MLAHTLLGEPSQTAIVLLHGLLASGRNLRTLGRELAERRPGHRVVLLDLPGHGHSAKLAKFAQVARVAQCAQAVGEVLSALGLRASLVLGHSFGGKVALAYAQQDPGVQQVWTLDSRLDADPNWREQSDVATVISALRGAEVPAAQRADVVNALAQAGLAGPIAEWLSTNLERTEKGYQWAVDFDQIEALTDDYFRIDAIAALEAEQVPAQVHVLRAETGVPWSKAAQGRLGALTEPRVRQHLLQGSGHWVHADNLPGLLRILEANLP